MMKAVCESFDTGSIIDFAQAAAKDVKDSREINVVRPSIRIPANEPKKREKYHVEKLRQWIRGFGKIKIEIRICAEKRENDMNEARIYVVCCAELIFNELYVKREKSSRRIHLVSYEIYSTSSAAICSSCVCCAHMLK